MNSFTDLNLPLKKPTTWRHLFTSPFFLPVFFLESSFLLLLRGGFFWYLFKRYQERTNEPRSLLETLLSSNTGNDLTLLLTILEMSCFLLALASGIGALFFYFISLKRAQVLAAKDLHIKAILGATPVFLTVELMGASLVPLVLAKSVSLSLINLVYLVSYNFWVAEPFLSFFITPLNFFLYYDLFYLGSSLLCLVVISGQTYVQIKKRYYG